MSTFVLIHGAMHGGWSWRLVRPILQAQGHEVFAPTLSGLGDRQHVLTRETGLHTHVRDIEGLLSFEDLRDVVLVGHSYGGMVAEQVAHDMPERIARIVHLHSFVPQDGDCVWELQSEATREQFSRLAEESGEGWLLRPQKEFAERWGLEGPLAEWLTERLTPMPLLCLKEQVSLRNPLAEAIPRVYVQQTGEPMRTILGRFEALALEKGWPVEVVDGQHDSLLTAPEAVARAILGKR